MNEHAEKKIVKARTSLLLKHFFWGRLALHLRMKQDETIPTLAVDGKSIFYNPDFVLGLSDDLLQSAVVHEIGHCMYEHISRSKGRDPQTWNKAGDYVINEMLEKSKFRIGEGWLRNKSFDGMFAEEVYDIIKKDEQGDGGGGGQGNQHGKPLCDIRNGSSNEAEQAATSIEWKVAVSSAAHEAKERGSLPAHMERFVDEMLAPRVPWREVLQRFVSQRANDDYTWARPNRKFVAMGGYLPALYSERVGPIDIVIDTSGSITQELLDVFASEIQGIADMTRPTRIRVIYCDAGINGVTEFGPGEPIMLEMKGGGGTDFRPPFKMIEEEGEEPVALIYLTDMYGAFPADEAPFPVLWCATSKEVAPWGETFHVEV